MWLYMLNKTLFSSGMGTCNCRAHQTPLHILPHAHLVCESEMFSVLVCESLSFCAVSCQLHRRLAAFSQQCTMGEERLVFPHRHRQLSLLKKKKIIEIKNLYLYIFIHFLFHQYTILYFTITVFFFWVPCKQTYDYFIGFQYIKYYTYIIIRHNSEAIIITSYLVWTLRAVLFSPVPEEICSSRHICSHLII